jgi:hypothetical protein
MSPAPHIKIVFIAFTSSSANDGITVIILQKACQLWKSALFCGNFKGFQKNDKES